MALVEHREIDQIELAGEFRHIQVRTSVIIEQDGVEISRTFHRHVLTPDSDVSNEHQLVQDIAAEEWTKEIKDAWSTRND